MDIKTEKAHSRYAVARRALLFWTLLIGVGAVGGAAMMLIDPSGKAMGMDAMLPYFQVLPFAEVLFQDFVFSGMALLIVNGLTNLTAAVLLLRKKPLGVTLGGVFGVTLMLWICIQFYMFPPNFMSTIYFIFGLAQAATGYAAGVFARQEAFSVQEADYPHVGRTGSIWWSTSPAWGTGKSWPMSWRSRPARRCSRSAPRSGRRGHLASGGAGGTACTAGICPLNRFRRIWRSMTG